MCVYEYVRIWICAYMFVDVFMQISILCICMYVYIYINILISTMYTHRFNTLRLIEIAASDLESR